MRRLSVRQVVKLVLTAMMDRIDTAMPDNGDDHPILATNPIGHDYTNGCIATALSAIQELNGMFLDDIYTTLGIKEEIKTLYTSRKSHPTDNDLAGIVDRMMERLAEADAFAHSRTL